MEITFEDGRWSIRKDGVEIADAVTELRIRSSSRTSFRPVLEMETLGLDSLNLDVDETDITINVIEREER